MPDCDLIVIGGSAGGLPALLDVLRGLPHDLPAAVLVVIHVSAESPGVLPQLLDRAGPLPAAHAGDGECIHPGRVYVAPPDRHLLVEDHHMRLLRGPKENGFRPAVDPLFRSAAYSCGQQVAGVILSGGLDDGTHGLLQIKRHGGVAIAQDPAQAIIPAMPASAIANVPVDHIAPSSQIAALLVELLNRPRPHPRQRNGAATGAEQTTKEVSHMPNRRAKDPIAMGKDLPQAQDLAGPPSVFTCPDCGGTLWEIDDGDLIRFRCHVGHEYTGDGLMNGQAGMTEYALWSAVRALEEHAALRRRMAQRMSDRNLSSFALDYSRQATESEGRAALIRDLLLNGKESAQVEARLGRQRKAAQRHNGKVRRRRSRATTGGD